MVYYTVNILHLPENVLFIGEFSKYLFFRTDVLLPKMGHFKALNFFKFERDFPIQFQKKKLFSYA